MKVKPGDEIVVDSEKAGTPPREGHVVEVLEAEYGTRYRVRWEDGHESTIRPGRRHGAHQGAPERGARRSLALAASSSFGADGPASRPPVG